MKKTRFFLSFKPLKQKKTLIRILKKNCFVNEHKEFQSNLWTEYPREGPTQYPMCVYPTTYATHQLNQPQSEETHISG